MSTAVRSLVEGAPRPARVLAVFPRAVYLETDAGMIAVVTKDGVHQPNSAVLGAVAARTPFDGLTAGASGTVGGERISLGPLQVRPARWWDPRPRLARTTMRELVERADAVADLAAARGRPVVPPTGPLAPLQPLVDALVAGDVATARERSDRLLGAGPGLTPSGDDALAGLIAGTSALSAVVEGTPPRRPELVRELAVTVVERAERRTTVISAAFLRCAAHDAVAVPAAKLLHALTSDVDPDEPVTDLLAIGSSSGGDLLAGMLAAVRLVSAPHSASDESSSNESPTTDHGRGR